MVGHNCVYLLALCLGERTFFLKYATCRHMTLGNHDYVQSVESAIAYTKHSRRWYLPSRFYTETIQQDGVKLQLVVTDTGF